MKLRFAVCSNCAKLMMIIGLLVGSPLWVLAVYPQESGYGASFAIPALASILAGASLCLFSKKEERAEPAWEVSLQKSSLTVLFTWLWGSFVGGMPFVLSGQLTWLQGIFEAVSGWTTTGLSVMDVSVTPKIFLFHRSFMQFCGGLGFVMMMIMLVQSKESMNLYSAEGHPDKLMPSLKKTVQIICIMYNGFLAVGTLAYAVAGMGVFDALLHTMCALSTGGFSTKLNSIGEYGSLWIELITIVLMIIGTTNFAVLLIFTKGKWRQTVKVSEIRFLFLLFLLFIPPVAWSLTGTLQVPFGEGLRQSAFNLISALSTTGYSTMSYEGWPPFAIGVLILMMLIGGGIGSTAGGIKLSRSYLMLRIAWISIRKRLSPSRRVEAPYYVKAQGKTPLDAELIGDTTGFVICYLLLFFAGTLLLTLTESCSLTQAMFEFASALGTVGLSIGITGPAATGGTLLVEIFGMILGRLEIFIVLVGIHSGISVIRRQKSSGEKWRMKNEK